MGFLDKIFGKKASTVFSNEELVEAGACPNCWGTQNYDGAFKDYVKDQTKDNINHNATHQKAFIQQFVETHVSGIKLKSEEGKMACPTCAVKV